MIINSLITLYKRDLNSLITEISSYSSEENLWLTTKEVKNSAGNLCLHLVGNLNAFIGAPLGNTGYIRQRDLEFSLKNVPRKKMIEQVESTIKMIEKTLLSLTETDLQKQYVRRASDGEMTTQYFLIHLSIHLGYHLGQINYHRRLLDI